MKFLLRFTPLLPLGCALFALELRADVNARYPYRLPDWFWQAPDKAHLLSPADLLTLKADCAKLAALQGLSDSTLADALEEDIARRVASKFAARDLAVNATIVEDTPSRTALAVQLDPTFDATAKATITAAVKLFLQVALEPAVIDRAWARSLAVPRNLPPMYQMNEGKPELDEAGRPKFDDDYAFYLRFRTRPRSPTAFAYELKRALVLEGDDPAVLFISEYSGNPWWGGSYYGHFHHASQQPAREESRGYLYVRLNSEKLREPEPHWNDPVFWAAKIAHEVLHNLSYWHPAYKDPAERDAAIQGGNWMFIVSYEAAIYERLNPSEPVKP